MTAPMTAATVPTEIALAHEFLAELRDEGKPWSAHVTAWARERGLSEALAKATRIAVLKIRVFGAAERHEGRAVRTQGRHEGGEQRWRRHSLRS